MKALTGCLRRTDPVRIAVEQGRLLVDPEALVIKRARGQALKQLRSASAGSVIPIDLEGVTLTGSCHAALFGPILERVVAGEFANRFVLGHDPTGRNEWDADAALRKLSERLGKKLVCVWETDEGIVLVGSVDDQVRATYGFVQHRWADAGEGATARELAQHSKSSIQAASNRLAKLATLGLAYAAERESVQGGGVQFRYLPVM